MRPALIADPEGGGLQDSRNIERDCHVSQGKEKYQDVIRFDSIYTSDMKGVREGSTDYEDTHIQPEQEQMD